MPSGTGTKQGAATPIPPKRAVEAGWTFLSNHAHVLICLKQDRDQTIRHVADRVGITERAVQMILSELEQAGYLTRHRDGRRNTYQIHDHRPLRHPIECHRHIGDLLRMV